MTSESGPFDAGAHASSLFALSVTRRAVLALAAAVLVGWIVVDPHDLLTPVVAVALALAAAGPRDRTVVDRLLRGTTYLSRSRWTYVAVRLENHDWCTRARGASRVRVGALAHRGRLDLAGVDTVIAAEIASLMDRLAVADDPRRLSWHVVSEDGALTTWLAAPSSVGAPPRWRTVDEDDALTPSRAAGWLYERWRYLRTPHGVAAVFQVRAVTATPGGATLAALAPPGSTRELSVVVRVAAAERAATLVGRQLHRWRANVAVASLLGFRRRASAEETAGLLERRERAVATGTALGEVDVFVVVRARTRAQLEERCASLVGDARRVGTTLVRGDGRHAPWFCAALPGGPGWRP